MDNRILQKYLSGSATEAEKEEVTAWVHQSEDNMREYMAQRKLYDISIWQRKEAENRREHSVRKILIHAVQIAAAVMLVYFATGYFLSKRGSKEEQVQTVLSPAGQRIEVLLSDGSRVWLNSKSRLSVSNAFNLKERVVEIHGEGFFQVASDKDKPFIVKAGKYDVKVTGTEFNIMSYENEGIWETTLVNGSVDVSRAGEKKCLVRLSPNTMVVDDNGSLVTREVRGASAQQWKYGLISFNDITIGELFKRLELYYDTKIIVSNTRIVNDRYSGKFRIQDGIEHLLKVLKTNIDFSYSTDTSSNTITIE